MMKLRKTLYHVICLMLGITLSGCIEEYEADIADEDLYLLVVEGTIHSGGVNTFYLSRTQAINSAYTPWMLDALVSVRGSDGSEIIAQNNYGYFTCQIDTLLPEVEYYLHIEVDDEVYESEPQKPLRTEKIADVRGVQNTPTSSIDILVTPADPFDNGKENYYSWTYDETWEVHPEHITTMYYDVKAQAPVLDVVGLYPRRGWKNDRSNITMFGSSSNYDSQHIQGLKLYDISRSDERMYVRYSGLIHQRAITKGEYEYELARRQASSEMGGLFTPQPSALPTNIRCLTSKKRAIGYIGCSYNTSEYRFFLKEIDYSIAHPTHGDTRLWVEDPTPVDCLQLIARGYRLCEWNEPDVMEGGPLQTAWAFEFQLDVRKRGAYIEEPEFWSWTENVSF